MTLLPCTLTLPFSGPPRCELRPLSSLVWPLPESPGDTGVQSERAAPTLPKQETNDRSQSLHSK